MGRNSLIVANLGAALVAAAAGQAANAAATSAATLGFDPARFGVPIYPGASVKLGGTGSTRDFSGRSQRTAVVETTDTVSAVANWYAANWPGALRKTYPAAPIAQFAKAWGATAITVSIARNGAETDIRIVVPGGY